MGHESGTTPSQTVGPFFQLGLGGLTSGDLAVGIPGQPVVIQGFVYDGSGEIVSDALIETWQAGPNGAYPGGREPTGFRGFTRAATDATGRFEWRTLMPGRVPGPEGIPQAPHLVVGLFMRGLLKHLVTRMYFAGATGNESDPILNLVEPERRHTLTATRPAGSDVLFTWNIHLQGPSETVFFDV